MPAPKKKTPAKKKPQSKASKEAMGLLQDVEKTAKKLGVGKPKPRGTVKTGPQKKKKK